MGKVPEKNKDYSTKVRKEGNEMYAGKKHYKKTHKNILAYYSKSIAYAPIDSEELALAYGNRSALLKHIRKYQECIIDVDRALKITTFEELKVKLEKRKIECLELMENEAKKPEELLPEDKRETYEKIIENINDVLTLYSDPKPLPELTTLLSSTKQIKGKLEVPKFTPSKDIPCIADSVSLKYNESDGRHMVATRDIRPGEIIALEKNYVVFPLKPNMYLSCSHCLNIAWNGIPCEFCPCLIYCSEKCKMEAWEEYHDLECRIIPFLYASSYGSEDLSQIIATVRLLIKAAKTEGLDNILKTVKTIDSKKEKDVNYLLRGKRLDTEKFPLIYSLVENKENTESKKEEDDIGTTVIDLLTKHTDFFKTYEDLYGVEKKAIKQLYMKLLNIVEINSFGFQKTTDCECVNLSICMEECGNSIGTCFTPVCNFFNHSCVPNVSRIFDTSGKLVLFTIAPIKTGEQLYISYGPSVDMEKKERELSLEAIFGFTCKCQACSENWPPRKSDDTFQQLFIKEVSPKTTMFYEFCSKNNISLWSLFNFGGYCINKEAVEDNIKVVEMAYQNFDSHNADISSIACKRQIENAFIKLYSTDVDIPSQCG